MSVDEKAQALQKVESPRAPSARFCQSLECPRATATAGEPEQANLEDQKHPGPSWNRLNPDEESMALEVALGKPV